MGIPVGAGAVDESGPRSTEDEDATLFHPEWRSRDLLQALPGAVYTTDAAGRITFFNEAAADFWGLRPELGKSEWCGSWRLFWPDGRPMAHDECPMAIALRDGRAIKGAEAVAERPDGTRVPFLAYPTPLRDESGAIVGAVNMLVDISQRKRDEEVAQRLSAIVESSDDAIVGKDLDGIVTSWNRGAEELFGYTADEMIGRPIATLVPEDRHDEEPNILDRLRRGERIDHYETVRRRKDGSFVEISLTVSPIRNAVGRIVGASKVARDITERRRAHEQQRLLLKEMSHRIKNLFALANGVVALSARTARTPKEMAASVRERLAALTRAHDLTLPNLLDGEDSDIQPTTLAALIRTVMSPYVGPADNEAPNVVADGPAIAIKGAAIANVALLMHEFATNAAKYGALSTPSGRVAIDWSIAGEKLLLVWREEGGPPCAGAPSDSGFGTYLAGAIVSSQLAGEVSRDWKPEGLIVRLSARLDRLTG
jgi:PAS domain S-box-containing protein